jgi:hypothetical protein
MKTTELFAYYWLHCISYIFINFYFPMPSRM